MLPPNKDAIFKIALNMVVFPDPEEPIIATISPSKIEKETSLK